MNGKNSTCLVLVIFVIFIFSGCETVPKKFKEEVSTIKTRVETLESRVEGVEARQGEVERASGEQAKRLEELKAKKERIRTNVSTKPRYIKGKKRIKEIQLCLKNAGFYDGEIDGVRGKKTRSAIREFQKANGLTADGIVGKRTWELLARYAEGPSSKVEEGATK